MNEYDIMNEYNNEWNGIESNRMEWNGMNGMEWNGITSLNE